jgi:hypothetical protein
VNPSKVLPQTSHGVEHHLETRGPPVGPPFRRLDDQKLAAAKVGSKSAKLIVQKIREISSTFLFSILFALIV